MAQSTVFRSNKTQAVRIPKSVALPDHIKHVDVIKRGNARLIVPAGGSWETFFNGDRIDKDFMSDRRQPLPQSRNEG
jgi:antitoxin VapB